ECAAGLDYYNDLIDEVHPNQTGYDKMADYWFQQINNFNNAPIVSQIPDQTRDRGEAFSTINLDSYVSDIEDDPQDIQWSIIPSQPQHFNVSISSSRVATISPKDDQWSGSEVIEFVATDNGKVITKLQKSDETLVEFTINWTPEITGQKTVTIAEDQSRTLSLDDLTIIEPEKAPADLSLIVMNGSNYSVNGTAISPSENYNGQLTVPVKISGGGKESDVFNLIVEVTAVNDKPVINAQLTELVTKQDSCIDIDLSMLDVTDIDNDYPSDFSLVLLSGNYYNHSGNTVCPVELFSGILNVRLRVSDGTDFSDVFILEIEVLSSDPVFILPDDLEIYQGESFSASVDIYHYAPETFSFSALQLPSWISFNPVAKTLSGTPQNSDIGQNLISLRAENGEVSADTSFNLYVINVNDPPVITSEPVLTAKTGIKYSYAFSAEDIDPGENLVYSATQKPQWASFDQSTGLLSGKPSREDTGKYAVSLAVSDGEYHLSQEFEIEVEYYNFPPEVVSVPKDTATVNQVYSYGISARDPEKDPVSYFVKQIPGWLEFYPESHVIIGTPGKEDAGKELLILGVSDGIDTTYQAYYLEVIFETSVLNTKLNKDIKIYPNPAADFIDIRISGHLLLDADMIFELSDINGRILLTRKIKDPVTRIDLNEYNLYKGLYFYRIFVGDDAGYRAFSDKLIIQ
ncbi:MAG: putative Ig domain-containing protein, partial [bacterium]